jgi:serine/threonine-protein kinase RsbT
MGLGLSGAKRLVSDFTIQSAPGQGTTVTIARWK